MIAARGAWIGGIGWLGLALLLPPGMDAGETAATDPAGAGQRRATADRLPATPITSLPNAATVERETVALLDQLLPPRSDGTGDWSPGSNCLHAPGDPRWLTPCIPGPPCDPSLPPHPFDLVGARGAATAGPIYRGPCAPRAGSHDCGPVPRLHRVHDALFDRFYRTK